MLSYSFYKLLHIVSVGAFFSCLAWSLATKEPPKVCKIILGLFSLLILVGGMGLMARVGIGHGEGWPAWIKMKMGIWLVLTVAAPIAIKRLFKGRNLAFYLFFSLGVLAMYLVIFHGGN